MKKLLSYIFIVFGILGCKKEPVEVLLADFDYASSSGTTICSVAPCTISFTNKSTPPEGLTYLWEFGDGSSSSEKNPTHTFEKAGVYQITLSIKSKSGSSASSQKSIEFKGTPTFTKSFPARPGETIVANFCTTFSDGDFLIVGQRILNNNNTELYLLGLDNPSGEVKPGYPKSFPIAADVVPQAIVRLSNGGFALTGRKLGNQQSPDQGVLMVLDDQANLLPTYPLIFDAKQLREGTGIVQLPDESLIIVGSATPQGNFGELALLKTNLSGKIAAGYPRTYGFQFGSTAYNVKLMDNNLIISGETWLPNRNAEGVVLLTDLNGAIQPGFPLSRGTTEPDSFIKALGNQQRITLVGYSIEPISARKSMYIANLNNVSAVNFELDQFYKLGVESEALDIIRLDDNRMVVLGVSWKAVSGDRDPVLLFLDNNGKVTAESNAFNNNRDQRPVGILPTEDKGILIVAFDFAQIDVIKVKNNGQF